uniref:MobQ family relaxase n=1 Tax=Psychrobacter sp. TaxID=56811 RepID=UPI00159AA853|nr:MobQ family relaxase [Psychrobacter sp.]QJS05080.1 nickase, mobilization protein MobL-like [Psychrobacter sp.]
MAIYHLSVKTFSRSKGQSATAAVAYRAGAKIKCDYEGRTHDYTKKSDVLHSEIFLPENAPSWAADREQLWNEVEQAEKRKNSTIAREFEVALPHELNEQQRIALVQDFSRQIVARHGCAVDAHLHNDNSRTKKQNFHAHIMLSTRKLEQDGFTTKTRELDQRKSGEVVYWREQWARTTNEHLYKYDIRDKNNNSIIVDHRSLKDQGLEREPTIKMGVGATALERKGIKTELGDFNRAVSAYDPDAINALLTLQLKQATELLNKLRFMERRLPEVKRDIAEKQPNLYQALDDLGIPTAEPEPTKSVEDEQERESIEPVSEPVDRLPSVESHTDDREQELSPTGNSQGDTLTQEYTSEVQSTDQTATSSAPGEITEHVQQPQATQEAVKTTTEPNKADEIAEKRLMVHEFVQYCEKMAQAVYHSRLQALQEQAKPIYAEMTRLKNNKPKNPFKTKAWQAQLDDSVAQHDKVRRDLNNMTSLGVTPEIKQDVYRAAHRKNPERYNEIRVMEEEVAAYDKAQVETVRQQRLEQLALQKQEVRVDRVDKGR